LGKTNKTWENLHTPRVGHPGGMGW